MEQADIFISGGGIAGLAAAAALGARGWRVVLADPAPAGSGPVDTRSTAFLSPSRDLFEAAGVWPELAPHITRLDVLRLIDTSGWPPVEQARRDFSPGDLGEETFGWNIPNAVTRPALIRALDRFPSVEMRFGTGFRGALVRDAEAIVTLTDGARISTRLIIGADGRQSAVREAAGIDVTLSRYGQRALAFSVTHTEPHNHISTEVYNSGGAFTLVPLPGDGDRHASAVVWMVDGPRAAELSALSPADLAGEATVRSCGVQGALTLNSPVASWPVVTQIAEHLTAPRTALIAEAAHVLPPIGAQGLNTSLADVAALVSALTGDDPGDAAALAAYGRARHRDIRARGAAIDLFNRVCRSGASPIQMLRRTGLAAIHDITPIRRGIMRAGLGR